MGQSQSKKSKKSGKDKDKDPESSTPPEHADTNESTPASSLSRGTAPPLSTSGPTANGAHPGAPVQVNVTDPDGTTVVPNGSGSRPPGTNGSPSSSPNTALSDASSSLPSSSSSPIAVNGNQPVVPVSKLPHFVISSDVLQYCTGEESYYPEVHLKEIEPEQLRRA